MSIRSALLMIVFACLMPLILIKPHVGVLAWSWFSYMNPHRLTWGFTYYFSFAQIIAGLTIVGWLISKEKKSITVNPISVMLMIFGFWICVTTVFSLSGEYSHEKFFTVAKILFFTFVTIGLITTRERINALIWVIVLSVGFFGAKGGIFAFLTGGEYLVWGPPDSFLADNNDLALAMIIVLPLMVYLAVTEQRWYLKWAVIAIAVLTVLALIASYSRGCYVGFAAALGLFWLRSKYRVAMAAAGFVAVMALSAVFSEKIAEEVKSIQEYRADESSLARLMMWRYGFEVAIRNPLTGGGFDIFHYNPLYTVYGMRQCQARDALITGEEGWCFAGEGGYNAHSIYFEALGEHGFVGFFIFLGIMGTTFWVGQRIRRVTKNRPDLQWARTLAEMLQISVVAYAVGGAFYNRAFFDLYYSIVALMCVLQALVAAEVVEERAPRWRPLSVPQPEPPTGGAPGSAPHRPQPWPAAYGASPASPLVQRPASPAPPIRHRGIQAPR